MTFVTGRGEDEVSSESGERFVNRNERILPLQHRWWGTTERRRQRKISFRPEKISSLPSA